MNDRAPSTVDFLALISDLHEKVDRVLGMSAHAVMRRRPSSCATTRPIRRSTLVLDCRRSAPSTTRAR